MSDITNDKVDKRSPWTPERIAQTVNAIGLIAVGGLVAGLFVTVVQYYWIAAAIGALLVLLLVWWQFDAALALYVLTAFVLLGETPALATGGSGIGKSLCISEIMGAFLLAIWLGKYVTGTLPPRRITCGFYVPLVLYIVYCFVNVSWSFVFWDHQVNRMYQYTAVNVLELGLHVLSAGVLVVLATSVSSKAWLARMTWILLAVGAYNAVNFLFGRVLPLSAATLPLIWFFMAGYSLVVALDARRGKALRFLGMAGVALAVWLTFIKAIGWVSGWLGLLVMLGTIVYVKNRRSFVAVALVAALLGAVAWSFLHENVVVASAEEQDFDRFSMMRGALRYATTFPLGVGLGNYRSYNSFYYGEKWGTTSYTSAHGTYSQHLAEMGFPGLVLFVAVLIGGYRWLLSSYRKLPDGPSKSFLLAVMGQLAGLSAAAVLGDYIIPAYHNGGVKAFSTTIYLWMTCGMAIAHVRLSGLEGPETSSGST